MSKQPELWTLHPGEYFCMAVGVTIMLVIFAALFIGHRADKRSGKED